MGVADEMAFLVLGSRARSARNCAQRAQKRHLNAVYGG